MDIGDNECENKMKSLCVDMIYLLDKLHENGSIDDEEYESLKYEKKRFLNSTSKSICEDRINHYYNGFYTHTNNTR